MVSRPSASPSRCFTTFRRSDLAEILSYARMRMAQRGVTEADVVAALEQEVAPPRPGNRPGRLIRCGLDAGGRRLDVVLNEHGEVVNVLRP